MVKRGKSRLTGRAECLMLLFRSVRMGAASLPGQRCTENGIGVKVSFVLVRFSNQSSPSVPNSFYTAWQKPTERVRKFRQNEPNYGLTPSDPWLLFLFRSVRIGAARQLGQRNEGQLMASFVLVCFSNHPSPSVLNPFYTAGQNPTKRPAKFKYNEPN
jgi:hypothetical protein